MRILKSHGLCRWHSKEPGDNQQGVRQSRKGKCQGAGQRGGENWKVVNQKWSPSWSKLPVPVQPIISASSLSPGWICLLRTVYRYTSGPEEGAVSMYHHSLGDI